eukprot:3897655-Rhodomonas_salina.1
MSSQVRACSCWVLLAKPRSGFTRSADRSRDSWRCLGCAVLTHHGFVGGCAASGEGCGADASCVCVWCCCQ